MPNLPLTEDLDFHYLLGILPPLSNEPEFAWLPELFSIVGHETILLLCKYAGGEVIKIPTIDQLSDSIQALQFFYDVNIKGTKEVHQVPPNIFHLYKKVVENYARLD